MFNERLKSLRNKKSISQYELAERLNLTRGQIGNYEQGKRQPDYETLMKIADFFDCTIDFLIGKSDEPSLTETQYHEALEEYEELIKELEPLPPEERKRRIQRLRDFAKGMSESD